MDAGLEENWRYNGEAKQTDILDLSGSPRQGGYLMLKLQCEDGPGSCRKIRIHETACYKEIIVERSYFSTPDDNLQLLDPE